MLYTKRNINGHIVGFDCATWLVSSKAKQENSEKTKLGDKACWSKMLVKRFVISQVTGNWKQRSHKLPVETYWLWSQSSDITGWEEYCTTSAKTSFFFFEHMTLDTEDVVVSDRIGCAWRRGNRSHEEISDLHHKI